MAGDSAVVGRTSQVSSGVAGNSRMIGRSGVAGDSVMVGRSVVVGDSGVAGLVDSSDLPGC